MKETRKRSLVTLVTKVKAAVSLALCVIFRGIAERAPWSPASYRLPCSERCDENSIRFEAQYVSAKTIGNVFFEN